MSDLFTQHLNLVLRQRQFMQGGDGAAQRFIHGSERSPLRQSGFSGLKLKGFGLPQHSGYSLKQGRKQSKFARETVDAATKQQIAETAPPDARDTQAREGDMANVLADVEGAGAVGDGRASALEGRIPGMATPLRRTAIRPPHSARMADVRRGVTLRATVDEPDLSPKKATAAAAAGGSAESTGTGPLHDLIKDIADDYGAKQPGYLLRHGDKVYGFHGGRTHLNSFFDKPGKKNSGRHVYNKLSGGQPEKHRPYEIRALSNGMESVAVSKAVVRALLESGEATPPEQTLAQLRRRVDKKSRSKRKLPMAAMERSGIPAAPTGTPARRTNRRAAASPQQVVRLAHALGQFKGSRAAQADTP